MATQETQVEMVVRLLREIPEGDRLILLQNELSRIANGDQSPLPAKRGRRQNRASDHSAGETPSPGASGSTTSFLCCFCGEKGLVLSCSRKNDLKRHMNEFHHIVSNYRCPIQQCGQVFETRKAFTKHIKTNADHRNMLNGNELEKYEFPVDQSVVFACGYHDCHFLLETPPSLPDGQATFRRYLDHVMRHYDNSPTCEAWTLSTRIRNLLRQTGLQDSLQKMGGPASLDPLSWGYESSEVLRRALEKRGWSDADELMKHALVLGSTAELGGSSAFTSAPASKPGLSLQQRGGAFTRRRRVAAIRTHGSRHLHEPNAAEYVGAAEHLPQSEVPHYSAMPENFMAATSVAATQNLAPEGNIYQNAAAEYLTNGNIMMPDATPSPLGYQSSVHTTPPTPVSDFVNSGYSLPNHEVFMGAQGIDPEMYGGMALQGGTQENGEPGAADDDMDDIYER
ncbi:hypothetical protein NLG97_g7704 [Lecanicillium saksenae]|uniref:Uncharacterized protein n=1 Tax=Lecanicillium saksenae TaxID=468837 RepID=A0ACC1QL20_9HYPO|nr:hypothetical protein NLG97_g7704 [Lecanicillium saksenae]